MKNVALAAVASAAISAGIASLSLTHTVRAAYDSLMLNGSISIRHTFGSGRLRINCNGCD